MRENIQSPIGNTTNMGWSGCLAKLAGVLIVALATPLGVLARSAAFLTAFSGRSLVNLLAAA